MKQARSTHINNAILAGAIFILWSLGIIFIPDLRSTAPPSVFIPLATLYLVLHGVIFIFAAVLLRRSTHRLSRKTRTQKSASLRYALLYVYVLLCLGVSAYLVLHTLYF